MKNGSATSVKTNESITAAGSEKQGTKDKKGCYFLFRLQYCKLTAYVCYKFDILEQ